MLGMARYEVEDREAHARWLGRVFLFIIMNILAAFAILGVAVYALITKT